MAEWNGDGVADAGRERIDERDQLNCENRLDIIAGATHLFGKPGALDQVAAENTTK